MEVVIKKDNALLYEVEYLISGKNSDIDNLKRVAKLYSAITLYK